MWLTVLRQAFATMRLQRRWAALTVFGIVWGTASVVLLVGWGIGVHAMVDTGLQKLGKNLVYVLPGRVGDDLTPAAQRKLLTFDLDDVDALRRSLRRADVVAGEVALWRYVQAGNRGRNVDLRGVDPAMQDLRGVRLAAGRFVSAEDVRLRRRVAVIGQTARQRLLGTRPVIGTRLLIGGQSYTVVGLLGRVGTQLSRNRTETDEQVWIPITTAMTVAGNDHIHSILTRPRERHLNDQLKGDIRRVLATRLHVSATDEEAVFIISMVDILSGFDAVFGAMRVFLIVLAIGSLCIGGIGVMNMMLVSVNERRREIGLRIAVGARRRDVVAQFMIETLVITLSGGAAGLAAGILGCVLLGQLPRDLIPVPVLVPEVILLAVVVNVVVGVLAGSVPAWRAARLDPADALRAE